MKNFILTVTIATTIVVALCSSAWATPNNNQSTLKGYISPSEPVYCINYNRSLLCTVTTDRKFDRTLMSLVARNIGKMTRPSEFVEVKEGFFDVRSFEYGRLSRIYIADNITYSNIVSE